LDGDVWRELVLILQVDQEVEHLGLADTVDRAVGLLRRLKFMRTCEMSVEELKSQIKELPDSEFRALADWLGDEDQQKWDRQIEEDSKSGALDFLKREAEEELSDRSLSNL